MRPEAFERLYAAHAEQLVKFLLYRTGDHALAEDLAADAFERAMTARRPLDHRRGSEKAWLYTIALNLLRDHYRRHAAEQRASERTAAEGGHGDEHFPADHIELRDQVSRALALLNADEREAVALRYGADLSVAEIARITREKAATVEKRLYRALIKLREHLHTARTG